MDCNQKMLDLKVAEATQKIVSDPQYKTFKSRTQAVEQAETVLKMCKKHNTRNTSQCTREQQILTDKIGALRGMKHSISFRNAQNALHSATLKQTKGCDS